MLLKQLLSNPYQVRLNDHSPFGDLTTSISHTGVQKAIFGNAYLFLRKHVKDGRNRAEIVVLLLVEQMYMNNLYHNAFSIFFLANILNSTYIE